MKNQKESEANMTNTVLIEQSAKNIKLAEVVVLTLLFKVVKFAHKHLKRLVFVF